jgi:hypothetical protein
MRAFKVSDGLSLDGGRHHFFATRAFTAVLLRITPAKSLFS